MAQQQDRTVDQECVREIRRLMAEGGDKAVEKKFRAEARGSQEYRLAQKQCEEQARRARELREKAAKAHEKDRSSDIAAGRGGSATAKPKTEREKDVECRKQSAQREQETSLSR